MDPPNEDLTGVFCSGFTDEVRGCTRGFKLQKDDVQLEDYFTVTVPPT